MSIQVVCPNGHPLTLDETCAGKMGLCPVCKAPIKVPPPDSRQLSEDAVIDFLGPSKSDTADSRTAKTAKKRCTRCNREILASLPACPYCHSYLAGPEIKPA